MCPELAVSVCMRSTDRRPTGQTCTNKRCISSATSCSSHSDCGTSGYYSACGTWFCHPTQGKPTRACKANGVSKKYEQKTCPTGQTCVGGSCGGCAATTEANCVLPATANGSSANGTCKTSYTGSCSYTCNNGVWGTPSSNLCTLAACNNPKWVTGSWGTCSGGTQTRGVDCKCDNGSGRKVNDSQCTQTKPATSRSCSCPAGFILWEHLAFGDCYGTIGEGSFGDKRTVSDVYEPFPGEVRVKCTDVSVFGIDFPVEWRVDGSCSCGGVSMSASNCNPYYRSGPPVSSCTSHSDCNNNQYCNVCSSSGSCSGSGECAPCFVGSKVCDSTGTKVQRVCNFGGVVKRYRTISTCPPEKPRCVYGRCEE